MELRKSNEKDILSIISIIKQAQKYFKENGIDQWQNNYPNEDTIKNDIANGESYVLINGDEIIGTTVISFNGESTYDNICEGKWISNNEFAVIHRIAVKNEYKGKSIASEILKMSENLCKNRGINSIKIDTHEDNKAMQKLLIKNDFKYCGVIYLEDNSKRIAFEKIF